MTDANGKGVRRPNFAESAWTALDHTEAVRFEGKRYRPGRMYNRPDVSERETACQPKRAIKKAVPPGSVVVGRDSAVPGRRLSRRVKAGRQPDLFE